jgi:hypothetical protein
MGLAVCEKLVGERGDRRALSVDDAEALRLPPARAGARVAIPRTARGARVRTARDAFAA